VLGPTAPNSIGGWVTPGEFAPVACIVAGACTIVVTSNAFDKAVRSACVRRVWASDSEPCPICEAKTLPRPSGMVVARFVFAVVIAS
jgi:hypothetical protein